MPNSPPLCPNFHRKTSSLNGNIMLYIPQGPRRWSIDRTNTFPRTQPPYSRNYLEYLSPNTAIDDIAPVVRPTLEKNLYIGFLTPSALQIDTHTHFLCFCSNTSKKTEHLRRLSRWRNSIYWFFIPRVTLNCLPNVVSPEDCLFFFFMHACLREGFSVVEYLFQYYWYAGS